MTSEKKGAPVALIALLVVAAGALAMAVYLYFPRPDRTVMPYELRGKWTCTDPKYKDRYLSIKKDWIYFGTGGYDYDLFKISSVKKTVEPERVLYAVDYQSAFLGNYSISFYYYPADRSLRIKNQTEIIWTK